MDKEAEKRMLKEEKQSYERAKAMGFSRGDAYRLADKHYKMTQDARKEFERQHEEQTGVKPIHERGD